MPKYTKEQLEDKSDLQLYFLAYDHYPDAYALLPTSRKHLIEAILRHSDGLPMWVNVVAVIGLIGSSVALFSGVVSPMMIVGNVILSLLIGVSTGFLINWVYETIKPPLPTQSKLALVSFVGLIVAIAALMGLQFSANTPVTEPFVYQVSVVDADTLAPLRATTVTIFLRNAPPLVYVTDNTGLAFIEINQEAAGQLARLIAIRDCYTQYNRSVTLKPDELPQTIPLNDNGGC